MRAERERYVTTKEIKVKITHNKLEALPSTGVPEDSHP